MARLGCALPELRVAPHGCASRRRHIAAAASQSSSSSSSTRYELSICTNKTCRRQGSAQVAKFGQDLAAALPISVETCGCLGSCGAGPNMVLERIGDSAAAPLLLHHISTPARLVECLELVADLRVSPALLRSTELRLAGNAAARDGELERAIDLYSQALAVAPEGGRHAVLSNRSAAHLAAGRAEAALADARAAVECCPPDFTSACVREADALFALGRIAEALEALAAGADRHPPFGRSSEYATLRGHIQKALRQAVKS